jgi:hypothetical protein
MEGQQLARTRQLQIAMFGAWQGQALSRQKRLPDLAGLLRKLEPMRVMSAQAIRATLKSMAAAFGANYEVRKREDT